MKKKLLAMAAILSVCFGMVACGGKELPNLNTNGVESDFELGKDVVEDLSNGVDVKEDIVYVEEYTDEDYKNATIEIIEAVKTCDIEVLKKYNPSSGRNLDEFIDGMESMLNNESYSSIIEYYKEAAKEGIIYDVENDTILIRNEEYIGNRWADDVVNGSGKLPTLGDEIYTDFDIYNSLVECEVYEKYYSVAPYRNLLLGSDEMYFEVEDGRLVAKGLDSILLEIQNIGLSNNTYFSPLNLIIDYDTLKEVDNNVLTLTNVNEKYEMFYNKDFDAIFNALEVGASGTDMFNSTLELYAEEGVKERVKEFLKTDCEFYNGVLYYTFSEDYAKPIKVAAYAKVYTKDTEISTFDISSLLSSLCYNS